MGLDRWQMEPGTKDSCSNESGSPISDYVSPPGTPTLAGIEEAASQMTGMLCKDYSGLPFLLGLSDADHLEMYIHRIWGKPDSCPFPKSK